MQPDSEEINLSTVELQVLSELDSRQFGFLKLNSPDHAKKKAVVIRAIKYLERMLIQAQCQSEREKRCKITANTKEIQNADDSVTVASLLPKIEQNCDGDDGDVEMLDLDATANVNLSVDQASNACETAANLSATHATSENGTDAPAKEIKIEDNDDDDPYSKDIAIEPRTYCKLGHFHLLLEDYPKALSAYQKFYSLDKDNWKDAQFLYGLGLVYYHYNAYKWATKAFQQLLYVAPDFPRTNEVHLRLGLMFKINNDFESSLKHLQLAQLDSASCTFSKLEIRFHMAHLFEAQQRYKAAKDAYHQLLEETIITPQLRADIYRQLGWMYHCVEALGDKRQREMQALSYLQKSIQSDPKSGQSLYLLGRCFAGVNKVHDAFIAYRNSVEKSEGNADTWCSIGVLYQQQNQPMDALQAYICAVQLDKTHRAAWTNLGILYESCSQPRDAYACYLNATKYSKNSSEQIQQQSVSSTTNQTTGNTSTPISAAKQAKDAAAATIDSNGKWQALNHRLKFLQGQLAHAPMPSITSKRRQLPSIEEAWNLPISAEMSSRQQQNAQANQRAKYVQGATTAPPVYPNANNAIPPTKRFKRGDEQILSPGSAGQPAARIALPQPTPPFYLNAQQLQMLQYLQKNHENLSPQHQATLQQLTQQYRMMQQHQQQMRIQQQQQQLRGQPTAAYMGQLPQNFAAGAMPVQPQQQPAFPGDPNASPQPFKTETGGEFATAGGYNSTQITSTTSNNNEMDQEIEALLSQKDIATSLAENLLKQLGNDGIDIKEEILDDPMCGTTKIAAPSIINDAMSPPQNGVADSTTNSVARQSVKCEATSTSARSMAASKTDDGRNSEPILKIENIFEPRKAIFTIQMDAKAMSEAVKLIGSKEPPTSSSILPPDAPPPCPPANPARQPLTREQLLPPTPALHLENKKQAYEAETQLFCLRNPVTVMRGVAAALKLDLGLFSTRSLVEASPDHRIEIQTQPQMSSEEINAKRIWTCASPRSHSTIAKYANYQAATFQESIKEERDKGAGVTDSDAKDSSGSSSNGKKKNKTKPAPKMLRFGTNIDLSDENKWRSQLQELQKLPPFARIVSAANMLSHMGPTILGMNAVQLYMKVPGVRSPGHQANNNFCRANINIGPGECEWFVVPEAYWGTIYALCEKHNINYLHATWWPVLDELQRENVPVYRFIQRPGDLVWINSGSVYWTHTIGWCNNVAWNVGPLTAKQYQLSVERYEWNKMQGYKSTVPMVHLSWKLAKHIRVSEPALYDLMRNCLMQTLKHVMLTLEYVRSKGLEPRYHHRNKSEAIHYCGQCEAEVFNVLLVSETAEKHHIVHCIGCARKQTPSLQSFVCLEEFRLKELMQIYDAFILHKPPSSLPPSTPLTPAIANLQAQEKTAPSSPVRTPTSIGVPSPLATVAAATPTSITDSPITNAATPPSVSMPLQVTSPAQPATPHTPSASSGQATPAESAVEPMDTSTSSTAQPSDIENVQNEPMPTSSPQAMADSAEGPTAIAEK